METDITDKRSTRFWWLPLLFGLVFVGLGIWILAAPEEGMKAIMKVIGIIAIMSGTAQLIFTFSKHQGIPGWGYQLIGGLVDLAVGIILVTDPEFLLKVVSILVAAWLFVNGVSHILSAGRERETGDKLWSWEMIMGVLLILLAVLFIWHPLILGLTIAIWVALAFIVLGVFRMILTFRLRKFRSSRR